MKRLDLTGQRFGRLTVVRLHAMKGYEAIWECRCECGTLCYPTRHNLRAGNHASCGCLRRELGAQKTLTHGASRRGRHSPEYRTWSSAKARCFNQRNKRFTEYGGRGITMCDRWVDDFQAFLDDMGPRPHGHSLDRINVDGNYEPGNCRWATSLDQARNKTTTKLSVELAREIRAQYLAGGIDQRALAQRYGVTQTVIGDVVRGEIWKE